MRKSDYVIDGIYNLAVIAACCAVSSVAAALVCKIISSFVEAEFFIYAVVRVVIITLATIGAMFAVKYKEGFKLGSYSKKESIIGTSVSVVLQILISMLFSFSPVICGSAIYVAGLVRYGSMLDAELILELPLWLNATAALALGIIYVTVMNLAKAYGAQNRKVEKYKLTGTL